MLLKFGFISQLEFSNSVNSLSFRSIKITSLSLFHLKFQLDKPFKVL